MKAKKILILFLTVLVLAACKKDKDITVLLKETGMLKVTVLNGEAPMVDEDVYLVSYMNMMLGAKSTNSSYMTYIKENAIDMQTTDENGVVDFGELNTGDYLVAVDGPEIGTVNYFPRRIVQVVSTASKEYSINVPDYVGAVNVTVNEFDDVTYEYVPQSGVSVSIIDYYDYNAAASIDDIVDLILDTETTNASGKVSFTLPSSRSYYILVYDNIEEYFYDSGSFGLDKDEAINESFNVNLY